jgi:hypothetical protein
LVSFGFSPVQVGDTAPKASVELLLLDSVGTKISQLEEAVVSCLEAEGRTLAQAVAEHMLVAFGAATPASPWSPWCKGPPKNL